MTCKLLGNYKPYDHLLMISYLLCVIVLLSHQSHVAFWKG